MWAGKFWILANTLLVSIIIRTKKNSSQNAHRKSASLDMWNNCKSSYNTPHSGEKGELEGNPHPTKASRGNIRCNFRCNCGHNNEIAVPHKLFSHVVMKRQFLISCSLLPLVLLCGSSRDKGKGLMAWPLGQEYRIKFLNHAGLAEIPMKL